MGDTLVRHTRRPFLWQTETAITLRLDVDVVAATARPAPMNAELKRVHKPPTSGARLHVLFSCLAAVELEGVMLEEI